jgi:hypothetical protein
MLHTSTWWAITVPDHWIVEKDEDCTTFTAPAGVGALQVSAAKKDGGLVTPEDLEEFAEDVLAASSAERELFHGWFSGFTVQFIRDGDFWRHWWLAAGDTLIYATYICAATDRGPEEDVAVAAVGSLRPATTGV